MGHPAKGPFLFCSFSLFSFPKKRGRDRFFFLFKPFPPTPPLLFWATGNFFWAFFSLLFHAKKTRFSFQKKVPPRNTSGARPVAFLFFFLFPFPFFVPPKNRGGGAQKPGGLGVFFHFSFIFFASQRAFRLKGPLRSFFLSPTGGANINRFFFFFSGLFPRGLLSGRGGGALVFFFFFASFPRKTVFFFFLSAFHGLSRGGVLYFAFFFFFLPSLSRGPKDPFFSFSGGFFKPGGFLFAWGFFGRFFLVLCLKWDFKIFFGDFFFAFLKPNFRLI